MPITSVCEADLYGPPLGHNPRTPPLPNASSRDLLIENAATVYTCAGPAPRCGAQQADATPLPDATVSGTAGRIGYVGPSSGAPALPPGSRRLDAHGGTVVPGFVDPHTHLVYAGDRRDELQRRLAGESYASIAAAGGGIVKTVAATRVASVDELVALARPRLASMLACGTTTAEVKSGYGLETAAELRMLDSVRRLQQEQPIALVPTFLGAHEVPVELRADRARYVDIVLQEMLPAVQAAGLAAWCDVFCEKGVFTPKESTRILEAGKQCGLKPRIHADELVLSGGAAVACEVGARSADHLIFVDEPHARRLAAAGVIATLLPSAAFFLKLGRFAPARLLIDNGVAVALASDLNPGGGFSPSMPFAITLACFGMQMTLEEALVAATINAAASLDLEREVGSLEAGKQFDAVVIDGTLSDLVRVGAPSVRYVIKGGQVVWAADPSEVNS